MATEKVIKEYLNDLDNLIDTGHFPKESIKDYTFWHKDMTLRDFICKGRELIRQSINCTTMKRQSGYYCDLCNEHIDNCCCYEHGILDTEPEF
jgi:hypothetical protein